MSKVVLAHGEDGDWVGLYIDGKLAYENHSIGAYQALDALRGHTIDVFVSVSVDEEWIGEEGGLPENLSDLTEHIDL